VTQTHYGYWYQKKAGKGSMVKKRPEKRIKDLMLHLKVLKQISPQNKAIEGLNLLDEHDDMPMNPLVLVVEKAQGEEKIVGILSLDDVLNHMESAEKPVEELPIFWQGQFHEECLAVLDRPVGDVMSPVTHVIRQSGTLTEAVHLMNFRCLDWLPVVEGGEVVGILLKETLLQEVLAIAKG
jgi:CBS domain-containing protein